MKRRTLILAWTLAASCFAAWVSPAFAFRQASPTESGLEEKLGRALTGLEEPPTLETLPGQLESLTPGLLLTEFKERVEGIQRILWRLHNPKRVVVLDSAMTGGHREALEGFLKQIARVELDQDEVDKLHEAIFRGSAPYIELTKGKTSPEEFEEDFLVKFHAALLDSVNQGRRDWPAHLPQEQDAFLNQFKGQWLEYYLSSGYHEVPMNLETIRQLMDQQVLVAELTNNFEAKWKAWLNQIPALGKLPVVVRSDQVGHRKPDLEIYLALEEALQRYTGEPPDRTSILYFDDKDPNWRVPTKELGWWGNSYHFNRQGSLGKHPVIQEVLSQKLLAQAIAVFHRIAFGDTSSYTPYQRGLAGSALAQLKPLLVFPDLAQEVGIPIPSAAEVRAPAGPEMTFFGLTGAQTVVEGTAVHWSPNRTPNQQIPKREPLIVVIDPLHIKVTPKDLQAIRQAWPGNPVVGTVHRYGRPTSDYAKELDGTPGCCAVTKAAGISFAGIPHGAQIIIDGSLGGGLAQGYVEPTTHRLAEQRSRQLELLGIQAPPEKPVQPGLADKIQALAELAQRLPPEEQQMLDRLTLKGAIQLAQRHPEPLEAAYAAQVSVRRLERALAFDLAGFGEAKDKLPDSFDKARLTISEDTDRDLLVHMPKEDAEKYATLMAANEGLSGKLVQSYLAAIDQWRQARAQLAPVLRDDDAVKGLLTKESSLYRLIELLEEVSILVEGRRPLYDIQKPDVILLGGPSGGGKSEIAEKVARRLGILSVSLDSNREVMKKNVPPGMMPLLQRSSYLGPYDVPGLVSFSSYVAEHSVATTGGPTGKAGVLEVVRRRVHEGGSGIYESVALLPGALAPEVYSRANVWLFMIFPGSDEQHRKQLWKRAREAPGREGTRILFQDQVLTAGRILKRFGQEAGGAIFVNGGVNPEDPDRVTRSMVGLLLVPFVDSPPLRPSIPILEAQHAIALRATIKQDPRFGRAVHFGLDLMGYPFVRIKPVELVGRLTEKARQDLKSLVEEVGEPVVVEVPPGHPFLREEAIQLADFLGASTTSATLDDLGELLSEIPNRLHRVTPDAQAETLKAELAAIEASLQYLNELRVLALDLGGVLVTGDNRDGLLNFYREVLGPWLLEQKVVGLTANDLEFLHLIIFQSLPQLGNYAALTSGKAGATPRTFEEDVLTKFHEALGQKLPPAYRDPQKFVQEFKGKFLPAYYEAYQPMLENEPIIRQLKQLQEQGRLKFIITSNNYGEKFLDIRDRTTANGEYVFSSWRDLPWVLSDEAKARKPWKPFFDSVRRKIAEEVVRRPVEPHQILLLDDKLDNLSGAYFAGDLNSHFDSNDPDPVKRQLGRHPVILELLHHPMRDLALQRLDQIAAPDSGFDPEIKELTAQMRTRLLAVGAGLEEDFSKSGWMLMTPNAVGVGPMLIGAGLEVVAAVWQDQETGAREAGLKGLVILGPRPSDWRGQQALLQAVVPEVAREIGIGVVVRSYVDSSFTGLEEIVVSPRTLPQLLMDLAGWSEGDLAAGLEEVEQTSETLGGML